MSFFKALIPGTILTLIVAGIIGSTGSAGGYLDIHRTALPELARYEFYWSWPLFIASVGLAWSLFWMME